MKAIESRPQPELLLAFWRTLLRLTRRHGLFTLARFHTRLFPYGQIVSLPAGATMFIPPDSHFFGFALGTHENHIAELLTKYVRPGDTCIDVGANIGYFSAILAQLAGRTGTVLAFEPVPENFRVLVQNAALAERDGLNIRAINAAVSAQKGELTIVRRQWSTYHQVAEVTDQDSAADRISSVPLDDVIKDLSCCEVVSLLKVDVEGHELPVIEGLRQSLATGKVRRMVLEVTPGADAVAIERMVKPYARRILVWIDGGWSERALGDISDRTDAYVEFLPA